MVLPTHTISFRIGLFIVCTLLVSLVITGLILVLYEQQKAKVDLLNDNMTFAEFTAGHIYQQYTSRPDQILFYYL